MLDVVKVIEVVDVVKVVDVVDVVEVVHVVSRGNGPGRSTSGPCGTGAYENGWCQRRC